MFRRVFIAIFSLSCLVTTLTISAPSASAAVRKTPVVFVHGYGACQDAAITMEGPFAEQYYTGTPGADLHHIAYYGCDTDGESIVGLGPANNTTSCLALASDVPCDPTLVSPDGDGPNTSITRFAYELAWYLYGKFGATSPVDLVGSSMGGLMITYALQRIAAHDPLFPPALKVPAVVTFSTPFGGVDIGDTSLQLRQMQPTSASSVVPAIQRVGAVQMNKGGYTIWATIGSQGCDFVPPASSTGLRNVTFAMVYTSPCYTHTGYLWDAFAKADARGTENGKAFSNGLHALDFMHYVIDYQERYGT